jgi:hypothetical protein
MRAADDSVAIVCEPVRVQRNALDSRPVVRDRTHVNGSEMPQPIVEQCTPMA